MFLNIRTKTPMQMLKRKTKYLMAFRSLTSDCSTQGAASELGAANLPLGVTSCPSDRHDPSGVAIRSTSPPIFSFEGIG